MKQEFDLVVAGGTPAGVCAAVAAARMGLTVALVEETTRLGGMLGAGLCHLDKKYFASVSGIIREWCDRNRDYYLRELPDDPVVKAAPVGSDMAVRLGTKFEPHIAEKHFKELVAEAGRIRVFYRSWPVQAVKDEAAFIKEYGSNLANIMGYFGNAFNARDDAPRCVEVVRDPTRDDGLVVATGRPQAFYVLYPWSGMEILCEGAVIPYYEYRSPNRLTDAEWRQQLDSPTAPGHPEWIQAEFEQK